jgi:hypothetical protein
MVLATRVAYESSPETSTVNDFARDLQDATRRLEGHRVYGEIRCARSLRAFMEHHVVCVIDFMALLKRLQSQLTCTTSPWTPAPDPVATRLINAIVLDEESDEAFGPEPASHYAWYVEAMEEVGADTAPVRTLESRIRAGREPAEALTGCGLPPAAVEFARTTFELSQGPPHIVAAAFVYGRERVLPGMFLRLVRELEASGEPCGLFVRYLERHIEVDSEDHGPAAGRMLERLLAGVERRRREAQESAVRALRARERLWDAVSAEIGSLTPA